MIIVEDNFFPIALIEAARATWPANNWEGWHVYENGKRASKWTLDKLPRASQILLESIAFAYSDLTAAWGAEGHFPDYGLHGAGLHQMGPESQLGAHVDCERHPTRPWRREASAVLYLDDTAGGELWLLDADGVAQETIVPAKNKLFLFTTPGQKHQVNRCRSLRRSLCLFFWSIDGQVSGECRAKFD